jgi:hypothetical protein
MMDLRNSHAYTDVEMNSTPASNGILEGFPAKSGGVSLVARTDALIRGILLVLGHHRVHEKVCVALKEQVHDYLDSSSSESVWLKRSFAFLPIR